MPDSTLADLQRANADLQRELAELRQKLGERTTERDEALQRETATAEVLGVINSSPGDVAPVFDAMLEKAMRLCEAAFGMMTTYDGERFHAVADHGVPVAYAEFRRQNPPDYGPGTGPARIRAGESLVHNADLMAEEPYINGDPNRRALVDLGGARTHLAVALRKDCTLLGFLAIYRQEVSPFSDKQVALLQNFAAQAVIAMENARLLTETRDALDRQTATSEVLQVINSSPGDLAPVFDAILDKAHSLCAAVHGALVMFDGEQFRAVALHEVPPQFGELLSQPFRPSPGSPQEEMLRGERLIHIPDMAAREWASPIPRAAVDAGVRTLLMVPLRKKTALLGYITAHRRIVRSFSAKEIGLLENFASQAVIAMENARLLTETREALEQQTATAEVLQVINSSPGDLKPVFDAMLEKATRLCDAAFGTLSTYNNGLIQTVASVGVPLLLAEFLTEPRPPTQGGRWDRIIQGENLLHIADLAADSAEGNVTRQAFVELGRARSMLWIALRKEDRLLGIFSIYRQSVRPFTDKQIGLLQNFAAQAVIAIENARLITETREALEQQTATAEVLQVINSSPGDLAPVFDTLLEKALRLCSGVYGSLLSYDGQLFHVMAVSHGDAAIAERHRSRPPFQPFANSPLYPIINGEQVCLVHDLLEHPAYREGRQEFREMVDAGGYRSHLNVALRKEGALLGVIAIFCQEVRLFTDKEVSLLKNFAAQAVIAMENARLITETREALEQQTATAEVLGVINSSPGDLAPVFEAMLDKALRLCDAGSGALLDHSGERPRVVTARGVPLADAQSVMSVPATPGGAFRTMLSGAPVVQIADLKDSDAYRNGDPARRMMVDFLGVRTAVWVALRKDAALLGSLWLYRREVRPFTDKQIALLQNFAAQAVIAMENARLLDEIRQRQQELRITFDNMADGVAMFDQSLHLAAWNRNFQEMLQLSDDFLAERHAFDSYIRYLTERGEFGETSAEAEIGRLRARLGDHYSFERTRPDGTVIEVRHNPMPDGGVVLIYSDITERKRSEAEIRAARDAAEAAYAELKAAQANLIQAEKMASLGQLTAGIAHEIKNPLNFVNNFAGLSVELLDELKETAGPALAALEEDKRADIDETIEMLTGNLEKIAEHGKRADNIVKSMLEHSRGVSGERREVDLNGLIDEALNLAYHGARAQDQSFNITLEHDYAPSLKPIEVAPQEITRVFLNLFGNAFYAANKRAYANGDASFRPILRVATCDLGDAVEVRVRDNGIGIRPEIKEKLFQPFFTTKPTGEGTGLGLSISYDIIAQQHGGTITVESEPGSFTEFTVRLPRH